MGLGDEQPDPTSDDLYDACLLRMAGPDGEPLWRPASLRDFHEIPYRAWHLYLLLRAGAARRGEPEWDWWRDTKPSIVRNAHLYARTRSGIPEAKPRCGRYDPFREGLNPMWTRSSDAPLCTFCEAARTGRATGKGVIGGVPVAQTGGPDV